MTRWLRRSLFLLGWLVLVLAALPATLIDAQLQRASGGVLHLTGASGTWWRGQGALQLTLPNGEVATLERLRWQLSASGLHVFAADNGRNVLALRPGPHLERLQLTLPAAALGHLSGTLRAAGLSGQLVVELHDLRAAHGRLESGTGVVVWNEAVSTLTPVRPLGNYRFDLAADPNGVRLTLSTLQGALHLEGQGGWGPKGATFTGQAWPETANAAALTPLLRVLGQETAPNRYRLVLDANAGMTAGR